jgi:hypothetical protein
MVPPAKLPEPISLPSSAVIPWHRYQVNVSLTNFIFGNDFERLYPKLPQGKTG